MKSMAYAGTMQENCLRLMRKKLLVSLAMEARFANQGMKALDEDDDILTAISRELVTKTVVGEKADALWREILQQHTRMLATTNAGAIVQPEPTQNGPLQPESAHRWVRPPRTGAGRSRPIGSVGAARHASGPVMTMTLSLRWRSHRET